MADASCGQLNRLARNAVSGSLRDMPMRCGPPAPRDEASNADDDAMALAIFGDCWHQAIEPTLRTLAAAGHDDIAIVPSEDLHLLPWTHFVDAMPLTGCRVDVYPSSGAWLNRATATDAASMPKRPRWAAAGSSAAGGLPWVEVERRLSAQLWSDDWHLVGIDAGRPAAINGVDALLGMGHGGTPDGNLAHAGLVLDGTVLTAHDLPRIRHCRCALMSACVLGRTEEVFGEPFGFLSNCFDYRTRCAVGWLIDVPDLAACLFSLVVQWSLRQACEDGSAVPSWRDVIGRTRQWLLGGQWPPGFGDWLQSQMPAFEPAVAAAPPAVLRRVLPWVVVLGR